MTTADELAVLAIVEDFRRIEPSYATGLPLSMEQARCVTRALRIDVFRMKMQSIALLSPWIEGDYHLAINHDIHGEKEKHILLHECAHVVRGDVREPTRFAFTGDYPAAEKWCDVAALLGVMDEIVIEQGSGFVEYWMRAHLDYDDRGWIQYRIEDLAPRVCDAWEFIRARDGDSGAAGGTRVRTRSRWRTR